MGRFRKMGRSCKKGSWGLGLHRSEQLDVEAGIGGVQLLMGQPSTGHGARGISLLVLPPALPRIRRAVDGTPTIFASSSDGVVMSPTESEESKRA